MPRRFKSEQLYLLEAAFEVHNGTPNGNAMEEMVEFTGLFERQISKWFQNRRYRLKKNPGKKNTYKPLQVIALDTWRTKNPGKMCPDINEATELAATTGLTVEQIVRWNYHAHAKSKKLQEDMAADNNLDPSSPSTKRTDASGSFSFSPFTQGSDDWTFSALLNTDSHGNYGNSWSSSCHDGAEQERGDLDTVPSPLVPDRETESFDPLMSMSFDPLTFWDTPLSPLSNDSFTRNLRRSSQLEPPSQDKKEREELECQLERLESLLETERRNHEEFIRQENERRERDLERVREEHRDELKALADRIESLEKECTELERHAKDAHDAAS